MAFMFISEQIKRDKEKYMQVCEKRKEAGKKGGRPKKEKTEEKANGFSENQMENKKANGFSENHPKAKKANNKEKEKDKEKDKEIIKRDTVGKPDTQTYKIIIDYLNEKTGAHFRHTTKSTQQIINGRFNEGFTVADFQRVIDIKCSQWREDAKMRCYLRPETLFASSHFESYLNEEPQQAAHEPKYSGLSEKFAAETAAQVESDSDYDFM
jgi:uncharacterized phage protein (TIGR02220 family)